ncbi:MAG: SDR family oxidoreductase [Alphaproteobacteria bacterium]|nr:SDR family oxidoreductase [Alphaproteobacteria bacterium]
MNKTVLVTGAASGIGQACAELLLARGAKVTAFDPQLERMQDTLGKSDSILTLGGDVSQKQDCVDAVTRTIDHFGGLDGLIHCGAAHSSARWDELEADEMNRVLAVNATGSFLIAQAAATHMTKQGKGSIVLTTSGSVLFGVTGGNGQGGPAYVSSKGAVLALTRSLARALGPSGVRVNAISPGITDTPMVAGYTDEQNAAMKQRFPLGRFADPEEIAEGAIYLVSDKASFMTGENMHINGGSGFGG